MKGLVPTSSARYQGGGTYLNPGRGEGRSCLAAGLLSRFMPVARQSEPGDQRTARWA